ncbi:predicted protein [Botrytis cinerea T4]|uniref:Uncharacterized protein n=1 Tax=Botryotinia fuckeliana (strain T4) TaxID=999810 RepID=G2YA22_BOTF4|nr:predicted protein [Botrytis cinerea T4]
MMASSTNRELRTINISPYSKQIQYAGYGVLRHYRKVTSTMRHFSLCHRPIAHGTH